MTNLSKLLFLCVLFFPLIALGDAFDFSLKKDPEKKRGVWLAPLTSLVFPGADQWYEGQTTEAAAFTGVAAGGIGLTLYSHKQHLRQEPCYANYEPKCNPDPYRLEDLGQQYYMAAGGMSAYYSFQTAVKQRKADGEFAFIKKPDEMDEILLAPFRFSFLTRWTTFVPLLVPLLAFPGAHHIRFDDSALAAAKSYNAGTWEESFFRGYLMPNMNQSWNSPFLSNAGSSFLFGAAHTGQVKGFPWPQTLLGFYLGWVTQRNDWSIQESIFIHAWWDVITIVGDYILERDSHDLVIRLPILATTF